MIQSFGIFVSSKVIKDLLIINKRLIFLNVVSLYLAVVLSSLWSHYRSSLKISGLKIFLCEQSMEICFLKEKCSIYLKVLHIAFLRSVSGKQIKLTVKRKASALYLFSY